MIKKFEINGVHTMPDDQVKDYLTESINKIEHLIPKHARKSAHVEAKLMENRAQNNNKCSVEVILHLPNKVLTAKESKSTMPEAIDLVETKLRIQLNKYKDMHASPRLTRKLTAKFKRFRGEN